MSDLTADKVRAFLVTRYAESIKGIGRNPDELPDEFDFLLNGIIDSFGILEMISEIEKQFDIQLDVAALDAEQLTILGPLSWFVAGNGKPSRL
jgi:acyl carrier protein